MSNESRSVRPRQHAVVGGGERAGGGAGLEQPDREARRRLGVADAAGRQHDAERAAEADRARAGRRSSPQVALGQALHVDVGERGRGALVLADLRARPRTTASPRTLGQRLAAGSPAPGARGPGCGRRGGSTRRPPRRRSARSRSARRSDLLGDRRRAARCRRPAIRSSTSKRRWRGTSGRGRSQVRGRTCRSGARGAISIGVAEARGGESAVRAPLRSMRALVTSVVPWITWLTSPAGTPRRAERVARAPSTTASTGRSGVVSDLADRERARRVVDEDQVGEGAADVRAYAVHGSGPRELKSGSGPDFDFRGVRAPAVKLRA